MTQEFLIRVATNQPITSHQLLKAILSLAQLPAEVTAVDCGDVENAPGVYADALKRYAERHGLRLLPRLMCPKCRQTESFQQHAIATYGCIRCSHVFTLSDTRVEEVSCS